MDINCAALPIEIHAPNLGKDLFAGKSNVLISGKEKKQVEFKRFEQDWLIPFKNNPFIDRDC